MAAVTIVYTIRYVTIQRNLHHYVIFRVIYRMSICSEGILKDFLGLYNLLSLPPKASASFGAESHAWHKIMYNCTHLIWQLHNTFRTVRFYACMFSDMQLLLTWGSELANQVERKG